MGNSTLKRIIVGFVEQVVGLALAPAIISSINDAGFTGTSGTIASLIPALYIIAVLIGGIAIMATALQEKQSGSGVERMVTGFVTLLVGIVLAPTIQTFATGTGQTGLANATFSGTIVSSLAPLVVVFYLLGILGVSVALIAGDKAGAFKFK